MLEWIPKPRAPSGKAEEHLKLPPDGACSPPVLSAMPLLVEQQTGLNLTDPSALPIRLPPIDGTSGALLIGTFIGLLYVLPGQAVVCKTLNKNVSLLGLILHQAERYARTFPGDSLWIKSLV